MNNNCLRGYECPECSSEGPFWIDAMITARVLMSDEGTIKEQDTQTDWEMNSLFKCSDCEFEGKAEEFSTLFRDKKKQPPNKKRKKEKKDGKN